jgi:putative addiction module killer protein
MFDVDKKIIIYETSSGERPYRKWVLSLRDKAIRSRIETRIVRLEQGNFGDTKVLGSGVHELRLFFGQGLRIYFGLKGDKIVILLCGGDKATQTKDIKMATFYWHDYKMRNYEKNN